MLDSRGILVPGRAGVTGEKARARRGHQPARARAAAPAEALDGRGRLRRAVRARRCPRSCWPRWRRTGSSSRCPTPTPRCTRTSPRGTPRSSRPGRSDFPNQINNVLAFPGVFRGALDAGARRITEAMKLAAADAIFAVVARRPRAGPDRAEPVRPAGGAGGGGGGGGGRRAPGVARRVADDARAWAAARESCHRACCSARRPERCRAAAPSPGHRAPSGAVTPAGASDRGGGAADRARRRRHDHAPWARSAMRCRPIGRVGRIVEPGRSLNG